MFSFVKSFFRVTCPPVSVTYCNGDKVNTKKKKFATHLLIASELSSVLYLTNVIDNDIN